MPVVEGAITEVEHFTPARVWGHLYHEGVANGTAHALACRSTQMGAQIDSSNGKTFGEGMKSSLYGQRYEQLKDTLAVCGVAL